MLNYGVTIATLLGYFYLLLGIFYPVTIIALLAKRGNELNDLAKILYVGQAIISAIVFLLSGLILIFQGWRLDPILAFSQFLLTVLIIYLISKDILINWR
jgi:Ycf66 protein N-terminus